MQARKDIASFIQKIGEIFAQAWGRFKDLINFVPNHGYSEYVIYPLFYNGLNDDSKQVIDGSAGVVFMCLPVDRGRELIEAISLNEEQYYLSEATQSERVIHVLDEERMKGAKDAMKNHGIPVAEIQNYNVDLAREYELEYRLHLAFMQFKYKQEKWQNDIHNCINLQEEVLSELNEELGDMGRVIKHLKMHSSMVSTQCDQIAKTQAAYP